MYVHICWHEVPIVLSRPLLPSLFSLLSSPSGQSCWKCTTASLQSSSTFSCCCCLGARSVECGGNTVTFLRQCRTKEEEICQRGVAWKETNSAFTHVDSILRQSTSMHAQYVVVICFASRTLFLCLQPYSLCIGYGVVIILYLITRKLAWNIRLLNHQFL